MERLEVSGAVRPLQGSLGVTGLICKLLHVSVLTGPSSGCTQLYKTRVQPYCHSKFVELSHVRQCMSIEMDMY
jgi:hypothetical protein